MVMDPNSIRKHHRVYSKKNATKYNNTTQAAMNRRTLLYGIVGLALAQGMFWGYMLGNKKKPSRKRRLF